MEDSKLPTRIYCGQVQHIYLGLLRKDLRIFYPGTKISRTLIRASSAQVGNIRQ